MLRRRYATAVVLTAATMLAFAGLTRVTGSAALAGTTGPYMALGDSYSSGEGAPPFDAGTDTSTDTCHRSANAYPRVFAAHTTTYAGRVTHVACSGAVIANLYSSNQGEPAQLSALSTGTGLVTVTIGGNDAGFASVLAQCVTAYWEGWQQNCQQYYTSNDSNNVDRRIDGLRGRLAQAYRDIRARSGNAAVWVLTYPHLLAGSCPMSGAPVRATDATWLNSEADHLADVIIKAARDAGVAGVVDERNAFAGHEVCTSSPWVNGYTWSGVPWNYTSASFHPTSAGYAKEAADLRAATGIR
jgi:lysophospholipase L1-like esterase